MNWDLFEGKWKQMKGSVRQQWGRLTDDDVEMIGGAKDRLLGRLQERYGWSREEAERNADEWYRTQHEVEPTHTR
ncbi:MAG: CsbD family protein [Acidobacteria bacterium]|nr:CsbD family protein [Acidobacteriota bacterium]